MTGGGLTCIIFKTPLIYTNSRLKRGLVCEIPNGNGNFEHESKTPQLETSLRDTQWEWKPLFHLFYPTFNIRLRDTQWEWKPEGNDIGEGIEIVCEIPNGNGNFFFMSSIAFLNPVCEIPNGNGNFLNGLLFEVLNIFVCEIPNGNGNLPFRAGLIFTILVCEIPNGNGNFTLFGMTISPLYSLRDTQWEWKRISPIADSYGISSERYPVGMETHFTNCGLIRYLVGEIPSGNGNESPA